MSYSQSAHIVFTDMLGTLDHLVAMAQGVGMTDDVLADQLIEDMFPLELQLRVALNQVLLALNQVASKAIQLDETPYESLAQVRESISAVRSHLDATKWTDWVDADEVIDLVLPNGIQLRMSAQEDIRDWIMPNFYFHMTMSYALLRRAGLPAGKMDFLLHMSRHMLPRSQ